MPRFRDELSGEDVITTVKTWFNGWVRHARASSKRNSVERECAKKAADLMSCLVKLKAEREAFDLKVRELKRQPFNGLGEGIEYRMSWKEAQKKFAELTDPPDPSWLDIINPRVLMELKIQSGQTNIVSQMGNVPQKGTPKTGRSGTTGYTLSGLEDKSLHLGQEYGVDSIIGFKTDDKKNSNQKEDIRAQVKKDNPRLDGEDDASYGKRISRLITEAKQQKSD